MFDFFKHSRRRRVSLSVTIALFVCVQFFGMFAIAHPTYAQTDNQITAAHNAKWIWEKVQDGLIAASLGSLVNGASYFMRKLAYDTAKYVASGGKGQDALVFKDGFGTYIGRVALDSAAGAIEQFGEPFGLNLCAPPDVRTQVMLQVGLQSIYDSEYGAGGDGPQPRCTWSAFVNNWENIDEMYGSKDALSERFNASLNVTQSDFGLALGFMGKVDRISLRAQEGATQERIEGQGFKPLTDLISGGVKTPAQVIKEETEGLTAKHNGELTASQIAGIYGSGSLQVIPMAMSVFANTLVSTLLQNILQKGLLPSDGSSSSVVDFAASSLNFNRERAEQAFSYLIAGVPQRNYNDFDIVVEYSACPQNPGLNNCVMDQKLVQAIERARAGTPLSIIEAMDVKHGVLLDPDRPLISPRREVDNADKNCFKTGYCYSNVQKLRKARVLPLGFEIATLKSNPDNPWTLGEVVRGFNDCDDTGNASPEHPFCHLIDPNWIIKAPQAQCEALVNGPELQTNSASIRGEECVDFSTCIAQNENGDCISFGYCTKEKNVWKMPETVGTCSAENNTCKTYISQSGVVSSYLSRTLNYGMCSFESVGCRAYSTIQDIDGNWTPSTQVDIALKESGQEQILYLNQNISNYTCNETAEGCSEFENSEGLPVYLKKAPEYLGCYDTVFNETSPQINWPQTRADLVSLQDRSERCDNFSQACLPQEVGCEIYSPQDGGLDVSGIVKQDNVCDVSCVGYETFKQEKTNFEPEEFPLYFIPSSNDTCPLQYSGCDEFTNIGELGSGGESLEYYTDLKYCERPEGNNAKVYYSWEGSQSRGYILKRHNLAQIDSDDENYIAGLGLNLGSDTTRDFFAENSPSYATDNVDDLQEKYSYCNEVKYNILLNNPYHPDAASPDCRALYDTTGQVYYRLLTDTVTVSPQCTPLRKTNSVLYEDTLLSGNGTVSGIAKSQLCVDKGGQWDGTTASCERCYNGGLYQQNPDGIGGSCIYWSIPSEAKTCSSAASGCRAYIGNTGNNIYFVRNFSFEPVSQDADALNTAKQGWLGPVSVAAESTQVGAYSLRVNSSPDSALYRFDAGTLQYDGWYELRFWARGTPQNLTIRLLQNETTSDGYIGNFTLDPLTGQQLPAAIKDEWQEYRMGPVHFTGNLDDAVVLSFAHSAGQGITGIYFIDNVSFVQVGGKTNDHIFLIKDSWKTNEGYNVPLACDSTPLDGLPGKYLGCRMYTMRDNNTVPLTGFDSLCREQAVGCSALKDTYNTVSSDYAKEKVGYNVLCREGSGSTTPGVCRVSVVSGTSIDETYNCTPAKGMSKCYIDGEVVIASSIVQEDGCIESGGCSDAQDKLFIVDSSIIIPADSDTIYLTNREEFSCDDTQVGCKRVGLEEQVLPDSTNSASFSFEEKFILNNPQQYDTTLCSNETVGCNEFSYNNSKVYFKDPASTGATMCKYHQVTDGETAYSGWFMDGVGTCSQDSTATCREDADCTEILNDAGDNTNTCTDRNTLPCYPDYLSVGNVYGLWSNGTADYEGFVGICEEQDSGCTEIIDPADTSGLNPDGKPYYVIYNDNLKTQSSLCDGNVSQKNGCVLFDMTENPNKLYDSEATYLDSEENDYAPVPFKQTDTNDTNVLLKVQRDRACSEWLSCESAVTVKDENGDLQKLCQRYTLCNQLDSNGECTNQVDTLLENDLLDEEKYIDRELGWSEQEYTGYSLFNKYNPNNYTYITINSGSISKSYLASVVSEYVFRRDPDFISNGCFEIIENTPVKDNGDICGFDNGGRCYNQQCLYPIGGEFTFTPVADANTNVNSMITELEPSLCKAFPEPDGPFTRYQAVKVNSEKDARPYFVDGNISRTDYTQKYPEFEEAHVCQSGEDCSCEYTKVEYKDNTIDYWPLGMENQILQGICINDPDSEGKPCNTDLDCKIDCNEGECTNDHADISAGECSKITQRGVHFGTRGLCLEYDLSRPLGPARSNAALHESYACLTWLPLQISASNIDVFNLDQEAGFDPAIDGEVAMYCSAGTKNGPYYDSNKFDFSGVNVEQRYNEYFANVGADTLYQAYWGEVHGGGPILDSDCNKVYYYSSGVGIPDLFLKYQNGDVYTGGYDGLDREASDQTIENVENPRCSLFDDEGDRLITRSLLDLSSRFYSVADESAQFDTQPDDAGLYEAMQTWAWKNFGSNALVLRVEKSAVDRGDEGTVYYPGNYDTDYRYRINIAGENKHVGSLLGLAPNPEDEEDTGTLMHPPRIWDRNQHTNLFYIDEVFPTNFPLLSTVNLSPGQLLSEADTVDSYGHPLNPLAQDGVYRNPKESELRESDIDKVYFVPLKYPKGAQATNPGPLSTSVYLDFSRMRNQIKYVLNNSVIATGGGDKVFPGIGDPNGIVWNYLLDNSQIPFASWDHNQYSRVPKFVASTLIDAIDEYDGRNDIARRYTLVFTHKDIAGETITTSPDDTAYYTKTVEQFVSQQGIDATVFGGRGERDPFNDSFRITENYNMLAIGMDFNADGEFLGYVSRWVVSGDDDSGINFAVIVTLKNQCAEAAQVYDDSLTNISQSKNKAWTDRVWENGSPQTPHPSIANLMRIQPGKPFGATELSPSPNETLDWAALRGYSFGEFGTGVPYDCTKSWQGLSSLSPTGLFFGAQYRRCGSLSGTATGEYSDGLVNELSGITNGADRLKEIFVKYYKYVLDYTSSQPDISVTAPIVDDSGVVRPDLIVPQIFSINPFTCSQRGQACTAGEQNNITINNRNYLVKDYDANGSDEEEDANNDNEPDPLIGRGTYYAVAKFFAFADDNRMPIRRVMIDWGDGSLSNNDTERYGYYKNRKPYCEATFLGGVKRCKNGNTVTQMSCSLDSECEMIYGDASACVDSVLHFGDATRACKNEYFESSHPYFCTTADEKVPVSTLDSQEAKESLIADGITEVCVFVPRVQVLDNWGWCNGVCPGGPGENECYNNDSTVDIYDDECKYSQGSWTNYQGQIIVIPT